MLELRPVCLNLPVMVIAMRIKSLSRWGLVVVLLLGAKLSMASVEFYSLKLCRDGRTLELYKGQPGAHDGEKTRFKYNEEVVSIGQKLSKTGLLNKRLWVYFHCMYGNNKLFHRLTLEYITEIVDNGRDNIVLSVVWPANQAGYRKNWKKALERGYRLENFFASLSAGQTSSINIISHSMGNRVFQGVWQKAGKHLQLENVILAAADLDADVFSGDFINMPAKAKQILVVQHDNDRLLMASKLIWGKQRLGRKTQIEPKPKNMVVLDATPYRSLRGVDMSNHLHFIFSDTIRHQLRELAR